VFGAATLPFSPSGTFAWLYSLLATSRGSSREPVLPILSQEICPPVKAPQPHGLGPFNFIGPCRSNDKPTDPRTTQTPQAQRVSDLPAYQRKRRYWFYDLTPRIPYLVAFAVLPEISPFRSVTAIRSNLEAISRLDSLKSTGLDFPLPAVLGEVSCALTT